MRIAVDRPQRWPALLILVCASCSTGCVFGPIGLGIGAAVPRWEREVSPEKLQSYPAGLDLDVALRPGASADGTGHLTGLYGSVSNSGLVVQTGRQMRTIPLQDVQGVDVRAGSYWAAGLVVGIVIDAVLTALVVGALLLGPTWH